PAVFVKGKPALLTSVLDGDAARQKDALWHYFALGPGAPSPRPPPPLAVSVPGPSPLVAQVPIHLPDGGVVESITVLTARHDLLVYDLGSARPVRVYVGGRILRHVRGRLRTFTTEGTAVPLSADPAPALQLLDGPQPEMPTKRVLEGYDRLGNGVRLRWRVD